MDDWRTTFPGAAAAGRIRSWIDHRIREVEPGDVAQARSALAADGWREYLDLRGVPYRRLARIEALFIAAREALTGTVPDTEVALEALRAARRIVTPGNSRSGAR